MWLYKPAFAVEGRHAHSTRFPRVTSVIDRYLLSTGHSAANPPAAVAVVCRWDRWTDARALHRPCFGYHVGSIRLSTAPGNTGNLQEFCWPSWKFLLVHANKGIQSWQHNSLVEFCWNASWNFLQILWKFGYICSTLHSTGELLVITFSEISWHKIYSLQFICMCH